jgi:hypothetical protein
MEHNRHLVRKLSESARVFALAHFSSSAFDNAWLGLFGKK